MASDNVPGHRDRSGRGLSDYPRPSVAVDTALLLADPTAAGLQVLEVRRPDGPGWALPGTFLHEGEQLIDAVLRSLRVKAGVVGVRPRQLHVFDRPDRDDRGWVLSVAHEAVVPAALLLDRSRTTRLVPVSAPGRLSYDHEEIIERAVDAVRNRHLDRPDPDGLLGAAFTIRQLRDLHTTIAGRPLQKDTFRRAVQPWLEPTGELTAGARGRPAALFRRLGG